MRIHISHPYEKDGDLFVSTVNSWDEKSLTAAINIVNKISCNQHGTVGCTAVIQFADGRCTSKRLYSYELASLKEYFEEEKNEI
jgi:hypothetical protein